MKAIRHSDQFEEGANMQGWLYIIMRNTFINDYRKQSKKRNLVSTVEEFHPSHLVEGAVSNTGDDRFVEQDINKALSLLTHDLMLPFTKYFEGFKYAEIADELNISLWTVKTRIYEARKCLQHKLKIYRKIN